MLKLYTKTKGEFIRILTVTQAARLAKVTPQTVRTHVGKGRILKVENEDGRKYILFDSFLEYYKKVDSKASSRVLTG